MAQIKQVLVTCDLDDGDAGITTRRLALDGTTVDIDLCGDHDAALRGLLADYLSCGRPVQAVAPKRPQPRTQGVPQRALRTQADRQRTAGIRAWAIREGLPVRDRGRMSVQVIAQYDAAHGGAR